MTHTHHQWKAAHQTITAFSNQPNNNLSINKMKGFICFVVFAVVACEARSLDNEIGAPRIGSGDELLSAIIDECFGAPSATECLKVKVLTYLDTVLGYSEQSARAFNSENIDKVIFDRVGRVINRNEFKMRLPEFIFQGAEVSYRADKGLDVNFDDEEESDAGTNAARGLLKKKLLLPVLLLLKLKMKLLMPIFVALIGLKAMKALILSKVAILLVVGFLVAQLLKKGGMPMAMAMTPAPEPPTAPSTAYGPAAPAPSSAPADSYSPHWEPSNNGPYARVWDSAQNSAYSAYLPASSSSYSSPSTSSVSIATASGSSTY